MKQHDAITRAILHNQQAIANAGSMTDAQRKAMFARIKAGGSYGVPRTPSPDAQAYLDANPDVAAILHAPADPNIPEDGAIDDVTVDWITNLMPQLKAVKAPAFVAAMLGAIIKKAEGEAAKDGIKALAKSVLDKLAIGGERFAKEIPGKSYPTASADDLLRIELEDNAIKAAKEATMETIGPKAFSIADLPHGLKTGMKPGEVIYLPDGGLITANDLNYAIQEGASKVRITPAHQYFRTHAEEAMRGAIDAGQQLTNRGGGLNDAQRRAIFAKRGGTVFTTPKPPAGPPEGARAIGGSTTFDERTGQRSPPAGAPAALPQLPLPVATPPAPVVAPNGGDRRLFTPIAPGAALPGKPRPNDKGIPADRNLSPLAPRTPRNLPPALAAQAQNIRNWFSKRQAPRA